MLHGRKDRCRCNVDLKKILVLVWVGLRVNSFSEYLLYLQYPQSVLFLILNITVNTFSTF